MQPDIDDLIAAQASAAGVSAAKLRCVYSRGVRDCVEAGLDAAPGLAGLARAQRFVSALAAGNPRLTPDADLLPGADLGSEEAPGLDVPSGEAWPAIRELVYGDGSALSAAFAPGVVESAALVDGEAQVAGSLDGAPWAWSLDLSTGESRFRWL